MNTVIEEYFMTSDSKAVKVLIWLLKNRNEHNIINATISVIAIDCNVDKMTVNKVFQKLYEKEFLVKLRNSQYQLLKI